MWMQDRCKVYTDFYIENGSHFTVTWFNFKKSLGGRPNTKPSGDHGTLTMALVADEPSSALENNQLKFDASRKVLIILEASRDHTSNQ
jgi:hypothetical protein